MSREYLSDAIGFYGLTLSQLDLMLLFVAMVILMLELLTSCRLIYIQNNLDIMLPHFRLLGINLVPRVSRARRDPGRVWSRASVTIENTREGSSLNKEFVAFVALIHGVVKFLQTQPRLRRAILQWPS